MTIIVSIPHSHNSVTSHHANIAVRIAVYRHIDWTLVVHAWVSSCMCNLELIFFLMQWNFSHFDTYTKIHFIKNWIEWTLLFFSLVESNFKKLSFFVGLFLGWTDKIQPFWPTSHAHIGRPHGCLQSSVISSYSIFSPLSIGVKLLFDFYPDTALNFYPNLKTSSIWKN